MQWKIYGLKADEMNIEWKKLQNDKFRDLQSSPSILEDVARAWKERQYRNLTGNLLESGTNTEKDKEGLQSINKTS